MDTINTNLSPARKIPWVWMIVALLVIVAAGGGYYWYTQQGQYIDIAPGARAMIAPDGKVVSGFPQELVLEKDVPIMKSYRVDYAAGGVAQPVVIYDSKRAIAQNLTAFRVYFVENGWELLQYGNSAELPATSIYAVKASAEANVTLEPLPDGKTRVTISYTVKN